MYYYVTLRCFGATTVAV